ncbi:MAG: T9SS type A sorting domain-containing protein, partial [Chloroflexota bacterium]
MITQTQYAEYSGDQLPEAITIPSGKVYVLFVSNGTVTAPGWELSYTSTVTDVNDITIGDANVYCTPNPATDWLRTEVRSPRSENLTVDLVSADGRTKRIYNGLTGQQACIIMTDVSMLEPGLYILRYRSESSSGSRKIVVQ